MVDVPLAPSLPGRGQSRRAEWLRWWAGWCCGVSFFLRPYVPGGRRLLSAPEAGSGHGSFWKGGGRSGESAGGREQPL